MLTAGIAALSHYQPFSVSVDSGPVLLATFTDSSPAPSGYTVAINWGDGTTSAGTVAADPNVAGQMDVTASHTYTAQGMDLVSVTINNVSAGTSRTVSSIDPALIPTPVVSTTAPTGLSVGATVGSEQVATFTDADTALTASSFSSTISWGDGSTSTGTITADPSVPGQFIVTASKSSAYLHAGDLTLGVSVSVPGDSAAQAWTQLAGMPQALGFVVPSFAGGMVYQIGGSNGAYSQTVNAYNPSSNSWTQVASLPGQDQALASTLGPDGKIYVAAYDPTDSYTRMDAYNPTTNTWSSSGAIAVASNSFSMTTGPDGLIYLVGGTISGTPTADVFTYDPSTGAVASVASLPSAREYVGAVTGPDGKIYALGGSNGDTTTAEVDAYDPATGLWTQVANMNDTRAEMVAATGPDGMIYMIGGYTTSGGWQTSGEAYNPTSNTWSSIPSMLSWRLYEGGTIGPDGRIYEMGNAGPGNEMDAYNPINTMGSDSAPITIAKGTPTITWSNPADILAGTPLGSAQLNAAAPIPGTFTYTTAAGDVLSAGLGQTLSASFTPEDTADYNSTTATATINVLALPTIAVKSFTTGVGQTLDSIPVATFTDSTYPDATAADFSATITWANGTTAAGVITADPTVAGQFDVNVSGSSPSTVAGVEAFQVSVTATGQAVPGSWPTVANLGSGNGGLAAASSGGNIYAIGGYTNAIVGTVEEYNPSNQTLTTVASLPQPVQNPGAATGSNGTIYAIGGDPGSGYTSNVYAYAPSLNTWTQVASLPTARGYLTAATGSNGIIYAIGGYGSGGISAEVDAYNPTTNTWTTVAPLPVALENSAAATGPDGKIYVIGGQGASGPSDQVFSYDPTANTWAPVTSLPAALGYLAATTGPDGTIYAIGGQNSSDQLVSTVYAYNTAAATWSQVTSLPVGLESPGAATGGDGHVYVVGGYTTTSSNSSFLVLSNPTVPVGNSDGSMTLTPGAATRFSVTGGTVGTAGGSETITVTAYDAYGNVATGYAGTIAFSSSDPQAVLPADATLSNGTGTFTATLDTAGAQSITATDTATPSLTGTETGLQIAPGQATHLKFSGDTGLTAGSATSITATAYDAYGNVATGYNGTVQLTSTDPRATLPSDVMFDAGTATFSASFDTAGAQSITATDSENPALAATDSGLLVAPGTAAYLVLSGPSAPVAGSSATFTLSAYDAYGNPATGYAGTVALSTSDTEAILPAEVSLTQGVGTFDATFRSVGAASLKATDAPIGGLTDSESLVIAKANTVAGPVVATPSQPIYGQLVTLSATYSSAEGMAAPTGMVAFYDGDVYLGSTVLLPTVVSGSAMAQLSIPSLSAGCHSFRAVYSGNAEDASQASEASASVQVLAARTSTTLAAATTVEGTTLTAKVVATSAGVPAINGAVSFYDGCIFVGTAPVIDGVATLPLGVITAGSHTFQATFSGGASFSTSEASVTTNSDGPKVVGLSRYGIRAHRTALVLTFDNSLNASTAENPANYRIVRRNGHPIAIRSAIYNADARTVTLIPARRLGIFRSYKLIIKGKASNGVTGDTGMPLDGSGTGHPGTSFVAKLRWTSLSLPGRSPAVTFVDGHASAYAGRFHKYMRTVLGTSLEALRSLHSPDM